MTQLQRIMRNGTVVAHGKGVRITCNAAGCTEKLYAFGWCYKHWQDMSPEDREAICRP